MREKHRADPSVITLRDKKILSRINNNNNNNKITHWDFPRPFRWESCSPVTLGEKNEAPTQITDFLFTVDSNYYDTWYPYSA